MTPHPTPDSAPPSAPDTAPPPAPARSLARAGAVPRLLRAIGALSVLACLLLAFPLGPLHGLGPTLITIALALLVAAMTVRPDADLGLMVPVTLAIGWALAPAPAPWRAVLAGVCLLAAHMAWAAAATIAGHGTMDRAAAALLARRAGIVLGATAVLAPLVVLVAGMHVGTWAVILGVGGAVGLFVAMTPLDPRRANSSRQRRP